MSGHPARYTVIDARHFPRSAGYHRAFKLLSLRGRSPSPVQLTGICGHRSHSVKFTLAPQARCSTGIDDVGEVPRSPSPVSRTLHPQPQPPEPSQIPDSPRDSALDVKHRALRFVHPEWEARSTKQKPAHDAEAVEPPALRLLAATLRLGSYHTVSRVRGRHTGGISTCI
ncbi:hypothetical protein L227DRAFT_575496 [Lentinus tigrinus ALCF2SS1-6]|uniref:Uncharacterized protein n=1 Tax=Lentinus tigrinus ALCF2SS1-6 TaxID=1328759 RepID=A0A5C2S9P0_9APHY|nr:hypothetical protein L227DRAFT_575496 [Lentinus tigrinus ALCF2SS1-6]